MGRRSYQNPPIKEVICEIRFSKSSRWDPTIPGVFYERLKEKFPHKNYGKEIETELIFIGENLQPKVTLSERAVFENRDKNIIVQIGAHYLAINHIPPYTRWENYLSAILEVLNTYSKISEPEEIEKIELRYINEFPVELFNDTDKLELSGYFNFYPYIGNSMEEDFDTFLMSVQKRYDDNVQKIRMANKKESIVLDITFFSERPNIVSLDQIIIWLEEAHSKNYEIFEGIIKQSLRVKLGEMNKNGFDYS